MTYHVYFVLNDSHTELFFGMSVTPYLLWMTYHAKLVLDDCHAELDSASTSL